MKRVIMMNRKTATTRAYLAGPMEGLAWETMTGWRNRLGEALSQLGIEVLDPCRRGAFMPADNAQALVDSDLGDIDKSHYLIANLTSEASVTTGGALARSWGTVFEIAHTTALYPEKEILILLDEGGTHPFLEVAADHIFRSEKDLLNYLRGK